MNIIAGAMHYKKLNDMIRDSVDDEITIDNCTGQRYIASAMDGKKIIVKGTPGNALGCYLNGCVIDVFGNTQEATGDTMNEGVINVHGSCGDAAGYAMRGGRIYIKENSGYRTGIHMKAYKEKLPVIVIGGNAGSFLGEYQAGGVIVVLGLSGSEEDICGNFCATGMHGGKIFIRCSKDKLPKNISDKVIVKRAEKTDLEEIDEYIEEYCTAFGADKDNVLEHDFYMLTPDTKNPYKQLYTYS